MGDMKYYLAYMPNHHVKVQLTTDVQAFSLLNVLLVFLSKCRVTQSLREFALVILNNSA